MNCIIEPAGGRGGLYLGDWLATMRTDLLIQYNIGAILSVAFDASNSKFIQNTIKHMIQEFNIS